MKIYIGLDLGSNGGFVALDESGKVLEVFKTPPTVPEWMEKLEKYKGNHVFCITEKVHSMPQNGGKSNFTFGRTVERALAMLEVNKIAFQEVTPQTWMKSYSVKKDKGESNTVWKNRLKALALQLFPNENVTLWNADAYLLAEFCRRNYK